jgi:peroxiredoxin
MRAVSLVQLRTDKEKQELRRGYMDATQPIIDTMVKLMSLQPTMIIIHPDGRVEHTVHWDPEAKKAYDKAGELIEMIAQKYMKINVDM